MLPAWVAFEKALGLRGSAQFICVAETFDVSVAGVGEDRQAELRGQVFIVTDRARWKKRLRTPFHEILTALDDYEAFPVSSTIQEFFAPRAAAFSKRCGENCAFQCRFSLHRNGVLNVTIDERDERAADAPQFPTGHRQHAVVSQIYFFLRDVGHRHQHHHDTTDTIVDLHEIRDGSDDINWRLKTLYSIYRRIISFKRQRDIAVQIQSVGLIAYAKAFKRIWLEQRPDAEAACEIPTYYDDAMRESIQASELRMRYKSQQASDRWSIFRTVTLALLGLIISFSNLIKIPESPPKIYDTPSPALVFTARLLLTAPFQFVGVLTAIILFAIFARSTYFRPDEWRVFRYVQALVQPFSKTAVFSIFSAAAILMMWFVWRTLLAGLAPH
jgi:hypothetical protein